MPHHDGAVVTSVSQLCIPPIDLNVGVVSSTMYVTKCSVLDLVPIPKPGPGMRPQGGG